MKIDELAKRLAEEGCNSSNYKVMSLRGANDCYCLTKDGDTWHVFYTERGTDHPPIFESTNEEEVCQFFFEKIMGMRNDHCVGRFDSQAEAYSLRAHLESNGIAVYQDVIPYTSTTRLYRVFVQRKAKFPTRELLGTVPRLTSGLSASDPTYLSILRSLLALPEDLAVLGELSVLE